MKTTKFGPKRRYFPKVYLKKKTKKNNYHNNNRAKELASYLTRTEFPNNLIIWH